jgi:hypothetical protein
MPNPTVDARHGRPRLGQEIALALIVKIALLSALWFAVFRPDPDRPRPSVADLFARGSAASVQQEKNP